MKAVVFGILAVVLALGITGTLADDFDFDDDDAYYRMAPFRHGYGHGYKTSSYPVPFPAYIPAAGGSSDDGLFGGQGFGLIFIFIIILLLSSNNTSG